MGSQRIIACSALMIAQVFSVAAQAAECSRQCSNVSLTLERPINLILEPQYENAKVKEVTPKKRKPLECAETKVHKLQYAPITADAALLKEKESPPMQADGAKYEKTKELYVAPASDHEVKVEPFVERSPEPAGVIVMPSQ